MRERSGVEKEKVSTGTMGKGVFTRPGWLTDFIFDPTQRERETLVG